MSEASHHLLHTILRLCAAAAPTPWYPRTSPAPPDFPRDQLDTSLERLRLGGLIALTEWVAGHGQGYVLTPAGKRALDNPYELHRLEIEPVSSRREPIDETEDRSPRGTPDWERAEAAERSTPILTLVLIGVNVAVFLLNSSGVTVGPHSLTYFLALTATDLVSGDWGWLRLLSCCFVHANVMHLLMNMYAVYILGPLLEKMWGPVRFLLLYLVAGLGGSCTAVALMPLTREDGARIPLVGASGAIWGAMVSLAVWVYLNRHYLPRRLVESWKGNLVVVFVLNIALSFLPGISAAAHFGGGIVGGICAVLLHGQRHGPAGIRLASLLGLAVLPLACLGALLAVMERVPTWQFLVKQAAQQLEMERQQHEAKRRLHEAEREQRELEAALTPIRKEERDLLRVYDRDVTPLLDKRPSRRQADQVATAIKWLPDGEAQLHKAAYSLDQLGPYQDQEVEEARRVRIEHLKTRRQLFEVSRLCLQQGESWTEKDETCLIEVMSQMRQIDQRWRPLVGR